MRARIPERAWTGLVATLLVAMSVAMGSALFEIWQVKQEIDAVDQNLKLDYGAQTTLIYDSKNRIISALYKEHRLPVPLEQMSEPLVQAVIEAEDRRFYEHNGVDIRRVVSAMIADLRRGRLAPGARTITQHNTRKA